MKKTMGVFIVCVLFLGSVFAIWCDSAGASESSIVYRLKWLKNMSTAGDLYAQTYGHFKAQGIDVTIKSGGPERDAIRELELGYAHFGVASADQVIRALDKGAPVVVVAQLFQVNPLQWIYRSDRLSINQLSDLKGRTLGVTFGKNDEMIMQSLLYRAQISNNQVRLYSVRLDYTPFYKGSVDLWPVYINTQGVEIKRKLMSSGGAVRFLNPNDHGVHFVANSVVTSEKMIKEHPETVKRFVYALLKGWDESMKPENSQRCLEIVRRYDRDTSLEVLKQQLAVTRKLVHPVGPNTIGSIDKKAWQQTEEIMLDHEQIKKPVLVVKRLITDYTQ